ncbi:MAG TPA: nitroreductase family deazaflavin-dependent oxidoreductase [Ktedonobacterales bacterium]|nr:nitroreductase family deazaflavin-dependent oxidoreductase [Ktedonobacterales bacterium]
MAGQIRSTRIPWFVPYFNPIAKTFLAVGIPMGPNVLVTIRGRKSGLPRTTPLTIVEFSGRRWLMAPFGDVNWVRNLRAAGRATIVVGRRKEEVMAVGIESCGNGGILSGCSQSSCPADAGRRVDRAPSRSGRCRPPGRSGPRPPGVRVASADAKKLRHVRHTCHWHSHITMGFASHRLDPRQYVPAKAKQVYPKTPPGRLQQITQYREEGQPCHPSNLKQQHPIRTNQ